MKKKDISIIVGVVIVSAFLEAALVIGGLAFLYFSTGGNGWLDKYDYSAETYNKKAARIYELPETDEIGDTAKVFTQYYLKNSTPFYSESYTLVARYDENEYAEQKEKVISENKFQQSGLKTEYEPDVTEPDFETDGFEFKTLGESAVDYPHHLYFVGFNDSKNEIAYIYFRDTDLDYIGDSLDGFIKDYCGWNIERIDDKL